MKNNARFRNFVFAGLGISLEWYDFFLYVALNKYWVDIYFHGYSLATAQAYILAIYCLSYLGRLVGGSILASFTDRYGRKVMFVVSSLLITGSSFMMLVLPVGLLPQSVCILMFIIIRFIQGFSLGGEQPGGLTFIYEHASKKYKATSCAVVGAFGGIGVALALGAVFCLGIFLTQKQIVVFGWRLPYIISVFVGIAAYHIRKKAEETRDFIAIGVSKRRKPFTSILKHEKRSVLIYVGIAVIFSTVYKFILTGNILFIEYFHYTEKQLLGIAVLCHMFGICLGIICGLIIDRVNRIKLLFVIASLFLILIVIPGFYWLDTHSALAYMSLFFSEGIANSIITLGLVVYIAKNYSTNRRASMITLTYNCKLFLASLLVLTITGAINHVHTMTVLPKLLWLLSIIPLLSIYFLFRREKTQDSTVASASDSQVLETST